MNLDFRADQMIEQSQRQAHTASRYVCAECKYAQLFAVQPRAVCTHPFGRLAGTVLFAGQPACGNVALRSGVELTLSAFAAPEPETAGGETISLPAAETASKKVLAAA